MILNGTEVIAAISTAYGRGGIAVIRVSGDGAVEIAEKMFIPKSGKALSVCGSREAVYGDILSDGERIDDGVAVIFRAPASYTGEDTVEISCHGGILLTEKVLASVLSCGARLASAGEFSQRAFVNGKIDLSGAEAIIGLIDAENDAQIKLYASHSSGVLKRRVDGFCRELTDILSSVYVCIDYPDEDLEELGRDEMAERIEALISDINGTLRTYREGKAVSCGIDTVIIGKPNVGKSSLLNRLLGEERAIVTEVAGTTRDVIEERLNLERITLNICDTAGIRETEDEVERIGVRRAVEKAENAELTVAVFDISRPPDENDRAVAMRAADALSRGKSVICALNKTDKAAFSAEEFMSALFGEEAPEYAKDITVVPVCAVSGDGTEELKRAAERLFVDGSIDYSSTAVISSARQHAALTSAVSALCDAREALRSGFGTDVCGIDIERAYSCLGEVDGRAVTEQVTDEIFHRFCVGK